MDEYAAAMDEYAAGTSTQRQGGAGRARALQREGGADLAAAFRGGATSLAGSCGHAPGAGARHQRGLPGYHAARAPCAQRAAEYPAAVSRSAARICDRAVEGDDACQNLWGRAGAAGRAARVLPRRGDHLHEPHIEGSAVEFPRTQMLQNYSCLRREQHACRRRCEHAWRRPVYVGTASLANRRRPSLPSLQKACSTGSRRGCLPSRPCSAASMRAA